MAAAYQDLRSNYKGEYVYSNEVARHVIERHSLSTTRLFAEFRAGSSWADLVVVNGTTTAYEIKSARDRLDRLPTQLASYRRLFDRTFVVCDATLVAGVTRAVPLDVGILTLSRAGRLQKIRDARSRKRLLDPLALFGLLREAEARRILSEQCGGAPIVPNTLRQEIWRRRFARLDAVAAHEAVVAALRERRPPAVVEQFVATSPRALTLGILSARLGARAAQQFEDFIAIPMAQLRGS